MKVVIQRVSHAQVETAGEVIAKGKQGLLLLVGITEQDTEAVVAKMAKKIVAMRIFEDTQGKLNKSVKEVGGSILSVSQFTLYADCKKGNRPSFTKAAKPEKAMVLYDTLNRLLKQEMVHVETGKFGADMKVQLVNDGPVTIVLDSEELEWIK